MLVSKIWRNVYRPAGPSDDAPVEDSSDDDDGQPPFTPVPKTRPYVHRPAEPSGAMAVEDSHHGTGGSGSHQQPPGKIHTVSN